MYSLLRKFHSKWSLVNRWKKRGMIKIMVFTLNFSFICYLSRICYERQVLNNTYFQKKNFYQLCCGAVFISATALLMKPEPRFLHCWFVQIFDKDPMCLIYLGYWRTKHWKYLLFEKDAKAYINLVEPMLAKLSRWENNF